MAYYPTCLLLSPPPSPELQLQQTFSMQMTDQSPSSDDPNYSPSMSSVDDMDISMLSMDDMEVSVYTDLSHFALADTFVLGRP